MVRSHGLDVLSSVIGWIYFFAWSISFYPQAILNFKRKSVDGMSFEYLAYNLTGFSFYFTFSVATYIVQHHFPGQAISVEPNDIAFAAHAVLLTVITGYQVFVYERRGQKFSVFHALFVGAIWLLALYSLGLAAGGILPWYALDQDGAYKYTFLEFLGYCKLVISFIKYVPQAYLNFRRESTVGWPIQNVLLDLTGGLGSFLQQFIDAYNHDNWGIFTSNIPKLFLAIESVLFDLLFIGQHFFLYRHQQPIIYSVHDEPKVDEREPLLRSPQVKGAEEENESPVASA